MKPTKRTLGVFLLATFASVTIAVAADEKPAGTVTPKPESKTGAQRVQTGSHIQRTIRRSGFITDAPNQVVVIDRHTIQTSGASDLRQLLNRYSQGRMSR